MVKTDIPQELLKSFVELALKAKDHRAKSVLFRSSTTFNPGAPDFDYVHEVVQKALAPPVKRDPNKPKKESDERGRPGRLRLQPRATTSSPASERRSYFEGSGTSHFTLGFTPR